MRVLVCGGRDYSNRELLFEKLDDLEVETLLHGGASGADALASTWAKMRNVPCRVFRANWRMDGPAAGPLRNQRMIDAGKPDLVVAFPGGRGTADMVRRARKHSIPAIIVEEPVADDQ